MTFIDNQQSKHYKEMLRNFATGRLTLFRRQMAELSAEQRNDLIAYTSIVSNLTTLKSVTNEVNRIKAG